jgi:TonB family protein
MKLNKDDIIALTVSIIVHILIFVYLYFGVFKRVIPIQDDGIFVNFGDFVEATGKYEPQPAVNAQQLTQKISTPQPKPVASEEMITQDEEETVHIPNTRKRRDNLAETKPRPVKQPTDEERIEEQRRKREEEQKRQEGNIRNKVSSAFNRSNTQGSAQSNTQNNENINTSGFADNSVNDSQSQGENKPEKVNQGSPFGNLDSGPYQGVGGFGSFSLSGRTLREGGLQRPAYTAQEEGRIVINIIVDKDGNVIFAEIGKGTNIDDASMRRSALDAARKAKFNKIQDSNNQNGTITYIYKLT